MTNVEIFNLVKEKKEKIENLLDPTTFVLNPEVAQLEKEISELQAQCKHEFFHHFCKFCNLEEEK